MNFGEAIEQLKTGARIRRHAWSAIGTTVAVELVQGEAGPTLTLETARGNKVPWAASGEDVLATDWEVV